MSRSIIGMAATLIATTVVVGALRAPGSNTQPAPEGLALARMLNTAQVQHRDGYAPLAELLKEPMLARYAGQIVLNGDEAAFNGYRVSLILTGDRRRYQIAIVPEKRLRTRMVHQRTGAYLPGARSRMRVEMTSAERRGEEYATTLSFNHRRYSRGCVIRLH